MESRFEENQSHSSIENKSQNKANLSNNNPKENDIEILKQKLDLLMMQLDDDNNMAMQAFSIPENINYYFDLSLSIWNAYDTKEAALINPLMAGAKQLLIFLTLKLQHILSFVGYKDTDDDKMIITKSAHFIIELSHLLAEPLPTTLSQQAKNLVRDFFLAALHEIHTEQAMSEQKRLSYIDRLTETFQLSDGDTAMAIIKRIKSLKAHAESIHNNNYVNTSMIAPLPDDDIIIQLQKAISIFHNIPSLSDNESAKKTIESISTILTNEYYMLNDANLSASFQAMCGLLFYTASLPKLPISQYTDAKILIHKNVLNCLDKKLAHLKNTSEKPESLFESAFTILQNLKDDSSAMNPEKELLLRQSLLHMLSGILTAIAEPNFDKKLLQDLLESTPKLLKQHDYLKQQAPTLSASDEQLILDSIYNENIIMVQKIASINQFENMDEELNEALALSMQTSQEAPSSNLPSKSVKSLEEKLQTAIDRFNLLSPIQNISVVAVTNEIKLILKKKYHHLNNNMLSEAFTAFYDLLSKIENLSNVSINFINEIKLIQHDVFDCLQQKLETLKQSLAGRDSLYKLSAQIFETLGEDFKGFNQEDKKNLRKTLLVLLLQILIAVTDEKIDAHQCDELSNSIKLQLSQIINLKVSVAIQELTADIYRTHITDDEPMSEHSEYTEEDDLNLQRAIELSQLSMQFESDETKKEQGATHAFFKPKPEKEEMSPETERKFLERERNNFRN